MAIISSYPEKTSTANADEMIIVDSVSGSNRKVQLSKLATVVGSLLFPVGYIYTNITGTNPNTELGFGTWTAFGAGRVMVGYDSGDTDFDTAEETGGAKTHTLTTAEMPSHSHSIKYRAPTDTTGAGYLSTLGQSGSTTNTATPGTNTTGGGGAHNNVQPYIVVHIWKRTA